jgi:serine phosphatase RsbU (regulator of sigma subunit)/predicted transcriptional regulator
MLKLTAAVNSNAGLSEIESEYIAKSLMRIVPAVTMQNTNEEVLNLLSSNPGIIGLPVIENSQPVGLINRNIFMDEMAKPFRRDLFARKSCMAFMDKEPMIVPENLSIQELSLQVVGSSTKTLYDGFIIIGQQGQYLGIGTGEDLVRIVSYLQAEKNRLVMESINYASIIQKSFLRSSRIDLAAVLDDYFIHWEPRDKVGGDYYFCKKFADGFFLALIDCTGHGVPGAFMTLIMASFLDNVLTEENRQDPAAALSALNRKVKSALGQVSEKAATTAFSRIPALDQSDDGMDTAFCWVSIPAAKLIYAGAKMPLFLIDAVAADVTVIDGDKKGVGYMETSLDYSWKNKEIALANGMCIYITSDGIIDQIGGTKNIAFGKKRFIKLLGENCKKPMPEQKDIVTQAFYDYQGKQQRRDDVSFLGFRIQL